MSHNERAKTYIKVSNWLDEQTNIKAVNPRLFEILKACNPSNQHRFIKIRAPFGFDIYKNGGLFFPDGNEGGLAYSHINNEIANLLSYSTSPVALILNKTVEIYIERPDGKVTPFKLFYPGDTFGEWSIMPAPKIIPRQPWGWNVRAGARTIFMPFKISDSQSFNKVKEKYNLKSFVPDNLFQHGQVFSEIAQKSNDNWCAEIVFFTKDWFEFEDENVGFEKLKTFFAEKAWKQFYYWSNRMIINFDWEHYISELLACKLKLNTYLLDTVKHLIAIGCGTIPGFRATDHTEIVAPTKLLKHTYVNDYQLKSYLPIIMHPSFLNLNKKTDAVYYSLQLPTLPDNVSKHSFPSTMKLITELKLMMDIFFDVHKKWPKNTGQNDFNDVIQFEYYHSDLDKFKSIQCTKKIFQEDNAFSIQSEEFPDRTFPETGHFFRGCVKIISNKKRSNT